MEILFGKGKKITKIEFALDDKRLFLPKKFYSRKQVFTNFFLYKIKVIDAEIISFARKGYVLKSVCYRGLPSNARSAGLWPTSSICEAHAHLKN